MSSRQTSKLGRNLKPGDVIVLHDHTTYPHKMAYAEVIDVSETHPAHFSGRRQWRITFRALKSTPGITWLWDNPIICEHDDRYDLAPHDRTSWTSRMYPYLGD